MSDIKDSLASIDAEILQDLMRVIQSSLNDAETTTRVAQEVGLSEDHLTVLAGLAGELSDDENAALSITTVDDLNSASNALARSKAGF